MGQRMRRADKLVLAIVSGLGAWAVLIAVVRDFGRQERQSGRRSERPDQPRVAALDEDRARGRRESNARAAVKVPTRRAVAIEAISERYASFPPGYGPAHHLRLARPPASRSSPRLGASQHIPEVRRPAPIRGASLRVRAFHQSYGAGVPWSSSRARRRPGPDARTGAFDLAKSAGTLQIVLPQLQELGGDHSIGREISEPDAFCGSGVEVFGSHTHIHVVRAKWASAVISGRAHVIYSDDCLVERGRFASREVPGPDGPPVVARPIRTPGCDDFGKGGRSGNAEPNREIDWNEGGPDGVDRPARLRTFGPWKKRTHGSSEA